MQVPNLTKYLLDNLRLRIISDELASGQKINEAHLSTDFGISRGPLREALRRLENEGLVAYKQRKGTYVTSTSMEDLVDIFQTREMIECYAVEILREKKIRDLPQLSQALDKARNQKMITPNSTQEEKFVFITKNTDFHIQLVKAAENSILVQYYDNVFYRLARYAYKYTEPQLMKPKQLKEHNEILKLIEKGSHKTAQKYLSKHIRSVLNNIMLKLSD